MKLQYRNGDERNNVLLLPLLLKPSVSLSVQSLFPDSAPTLKTLLRSENSAITIIRRKIMGAIKLKLRSPTVDGITADPQPDWSFENLLSELDTIEKKLNVSSNFPVQFTKTPPREFQASKETNKYSRGFIMHLSDNELEKTDSDSEEEVDDSSMVMGTRFACDECYMSDDSEDELPLGIPCLMNKVGLVEGALSELIHDLQFSVTEEVRNQVSTLETDLANENEKFAAVIAQVEQHRESQRERDKKFDLHYQRTIAEALDNHLTAVQRDHEHRSQIEERRLRDDAAREEVKRREKAQQEKLWQEKIKAEEEARLKAERAEKAKKAALEAEKRAAQEAAVKITVETKTDSATKTVGQSMVSGNDFKKEVRLSGNIIKAASNALELEERRLQTHKELSAKNEAIQLSTNKDYHGHGQHFYRQIKTISASVENVRTKADELVRLINSPECPQSISILMFAQKVVSQSANPQKSFNGIIFAYSRVIVLVTSKIPLAMDVLLAELNRACIYTVPKHINYSVAKFKTKDAYYKAIGYEEKDGKIETTDSYVERLRAYMKLYGALVQTEVGGVQNLHGLREGWAWLARLLNALPANLYTAVALISFIEMAGFALYRRYRTQFEKLLNIIAHDFLNSLKEGDPELDTKLNQVKVNIRHYLESNQFKKEPVGLQLRSHLESSDFY
ncbi:Protein GLE1 [Abeliophyllum distichum]|uniref:mRNA export factor GLE1 n=1 Tax=Abeliophyllum distichum TaxID=126358 RepID=A0ABD1W0Y6_9LAMI